MRVPVTSSSQAINTHCDPRTLAGRTPSSQGAKNSLGWGWPSLLPLILLRELGPKVRRAWKAGKQSEDREDGRTLGAAGGFHIREAGTQPTVLHFAEAGREGAWPCFLPWGIPP